MIVTYEERKCWHGSCVLVDKYIGYGKGKFMNIGTQICKILLIGLTIIVTSTGAGAVVISSGSSVGTVPGATGTGLDGEYFNRNVDTPSVAAAELFMSSNSADATFKSTALDYPNGGANVATDASTTLSGFLGADSGSLSGSGGDLIDRMILRFTGFIAINQAGTVNFAMDSDDGSVLRIAGQTIVDRDFPHGFSGFVFGDADFQAAGLYEFEVIYFENTASGGIELYSSIAGGVNSGAPGGGTVGIVPTAILYDSTFAPQVSEPGMLVIFGAGLLIISTIRRRYKG